jgi:hypothetical protein
MGFRKQMKARTAPGPRHKTQVMKSKNKKSIVRVLLTYPPGPGLDEAEVLWLGLHTLHVHLRTRISTLTLMPRPGSVITTVFNSKFSIFNMENYLFLIRLLST